MEELLFDVHHLIFYTSFKPKSKSFHDFPTEFAEFFDAILVFTTQNSTKRMKYINLKSLAKFTRIINIFNKINKIEFNGISINLFIQMEIYEIIKMFFNIF